MCEIVHKIIQIEPLLTHIVNFLEGKVLSLKTKNDETEMKTTIVKTTIHLLQHMVLTILCISHMYSTNGRHSNMQ